MCALCHRSPLCVLLRNTLTGFCDAGKNWNILRQCQQHAASQGGGFDALEPTADQKVECDEPEGRFLQQIRQHYERASTSLLNMMLSHFQLKDWLASCKNFFLLHQGDYLTNFLDCAEAELDKLVTKASMSLLRGQLEMAVKTSSLAHDSHNDKLQFVLDPNSFTDLHSVCNPFLCSPESKLSQLQQSRDRACSP